MNISVETLPECKATLNVEVPADKVANERDRIVTTYMSQAKLPGFRPGKVPKNVVAKRFQKQIEEELTERLVNEGCREGIKENDIEILSVGEVGEQTFNVDGTFSFIAQLTTAPKFELPEYKNIPIKIPKIEVTDEDIGKTLENFREKLADFNDIDDRPLQGDDVAVIDYKGSIGGKPVGEVIPKANAYIAQNHDYWIKITADSFLPGFCDQLKGATAGETRTVKVTLPEDFPFEEVVGKEIEYEVTVKEIKEQLLPALDDDFAGKVRPGNTLAELRESLVDEIKTDRERQADNMKTEQVSAYLTQQLDFELPPEIVKSETQAQVNEIVERSQRSGMEEDKIVEHQEEIFDTASNLARNNIKTSFILHEIAKKEEISVGEPELLERVHAMAQHNQMPVKKFAKKLQKENAFGRIREGMLVTKTLEFLKSNASIEEVEPTPEEGAVS